MPRPGSGGAEVYFGTTAPLSPSNGDFWYDNSSTGVLNFRREGSWLAVAVATADFNALSNAVSVLSNNVSVLSQAVSVISQAQSAVSQALSVLSNSVSVLSQAVSVLSQSVSVLSNSVSVLSQAVSVLSQAHSALSQAVSALSVTHDTLSQAHSVLSNIVSVISAGLGGVQLKVVAGTQLISALVTTAISGMSAVLAAGATYQIDGNIIYNMSVAGGVIFNISGTTSAPTGAARMQAATLVAGGSLSAREWANQQGFPWVCSVSPTTVSIFTVKLDAVVKTSAAFTLQAFALLSGAGTDLNIRIGSYLRAFKIA